MQVTTQNKFLKLSITILLGFGIFNPSWGQSQQSVDATFSIGKDIALSSIAYQKLYHYGAKKRLITGFGLRLNNNLGHHQSLVTAPAKVSEGNFFKKQNETKLDTLVLNSHNVLSLNVGIFLGYQVSKKVSVEFNIDALGFSLGAKQNGTFYARSQKLAPTQQEAKVTTLNALLTGDYDYGSLNSELIANIKLNDKLGLKVGTSFVFTEYTTLNKLTFNNDRFRNKSLLPSLGLRYQL